MALIKLPAKERHIKGKPRGVRLENAGILLQLANHYWLWLLVLPIVAILIAGYLYLLSPKLATIREKSQNLLPNKRALLSDLLAVEQKLIDLEQKFRTVKIDKQQELQRIYSIIPTEPDYASLFVQAQFLADSNNLKLRNVNISQVLDRPVATRGGQTTAAVGPGPAAQLPHLFL